VKPEYIPYLIGAAATIVVAFVSYFLGKRSALKVHESQRRHAARDKFRAAIAQEISLWHRMDATSDRLVGRADTRFLEETPVIADLIQFRPFVKNREAYDKATKQYETYKAEMFRGRMGSIGIHPDSYRLLEALLRFADE
jgi:hypothetical protein